MDPIHPIIPQQPTIAPVTPAPTAGRIDRERRGNADAGRKRRRQAPQDRARPELGAPEADWFSQHDDDDDADTGVHVDITA
jgi:hypothetical protein